MGKKPWRLKVIAYFILGYLAAILTVAVLAHLSSGGFSQAIDAVTELLEIISPVLAVVSVVLGICSICQANDGSNQVSKVISDVDGVSTALNKTTDTINSVSILLDQVSDNLNEALERLTTIYELQCKLGVDMNQLRRGSPGGPAQEGNVGGDAPPMKQFGDEADPAT